MYYSSVNIMITRTKIIFSFVIFSFVEISSNKAIDAFSNDSTLLPFNTRSPVKIQNLYLTPAP